MLYLTTLSTHYSYGYMESAICYRTTQSNLYVQIALPGGMLLETINSDMWKGRKEMLYLTTLSTHYSYDYLASDIW